MTKFSNALLLCVLFSLPFLLSCSKSSGEKEDTDQPPPIGNKISRGLLATVAPRQDGDPDTAYLRTHNSSWDLTGLPEDYKTNSDISEEDVWEIVWDGAHYVLKSHFSKYIKAGSTTQLENINYYAIEFSTGNSDSAKLELKKDDKDHFSIESEFRPGFFMATYQTSKDRPIHNAVRFLKGQSQKWFLITVDHLFF